MKKALKNMKVPAAIVTTVAITAVAVGTVSAQGQSSAPQTITIMENAASPLPSADQNIIQNTLDKTLNVNINLNDFQSASDYQNQLNVQFAAGNFPDLFEVPNRAELVTLENQGALLNLSNYRKELAQAIHFTHGSLALGQVGGQLYAISKAPQLNYSTYWIRKDWLDKLGLKMPRTLPQFYQVAKAFVNQNAGGNGKKGTYGLVGQGLAAFAPIFGAFGVGLPVNDGDLYIKNGKLVDAYYDPNMPKALAFIKQLVKAGIVDPSIVTINSPQQEQQSAFEGQDGIMFLDWPNVMKENFVQEWKKVDPKADWVQMPTLKGPYGQFDGSFPLENSGGMFAIPAVVGKQPQVLKKVFQLLNYVSTPAGNNLVDYGLPGRDYKVQNAKVIPTSLGSQEGGYFWVYQFTGRPELQYLDTKFAQQAPYIKYAASQPAIKTLNEFVSYPSGYNANDADTYAFQQIVDFIYGKEPLSQYPQFLHTLSTTYGFQTFLHAAQSQLGQMGLVKK